jgi:hypothetical protein
MSVSRVIPRRMLLAGLAVVSIAAFPAVASAESKSFTVSFSDGSECTATASSSSPALALWLHDNISSSGSTSCNLGLSTPNLKMNRVYDPHYNNVVVVSRSDAPSINGYAACQPSTSCWQYSQATVAPASASPPTVERHFRVGWPRDDLAGYPTPTLVVGPTTACTFYSSMVDCSLTTGV